LFYLLSNNLFVVFSLSNRIPFMVLWQDDIKKPPKLIDGFNFK